MKYTTKKRCLITSRLSLGASSRCLVRRCRGCRGWSTCRSRDTSLRCTVSRMRRLLRRRGYWLRQDSRSTSMTSWIQTWLASKVIQWNKITRWARVWTTRQRCVRRSSVYWGDRPCSVSSATWVAHTALPMTSNGKVAKCWWRISVRHFWVREMATWTRRARVNCHQWVV